MPAPPRWSPWLLLGALALGLLASTLHRARPEKARSDLPVYLAAADATWEGREPFGVKSARGWPYIYPPTLATLILPLRPLPLRAAAGAWFLLSAGALALGVLATRAALLGPPPADAPAPDEAPAPTSGASAPPTRLGFRWVDDGLPLLLVLLPSASALLRGQVGPLLLGLLAGAGWALTRRREALAGALVALATALKVFPALVLVGLLAARRWRAAAAALLALPVWLVLVPAPFLGLSGALASNEAFARGMLVRYAEDPGSSALGDTPLVDTNQSLASQVVRRLDPGPFRSALLLLLLGAVSGAALAAAARAPRDGALRPGAAGLALLVAAPLLAAPIAFHHYHVLLHPALALLVRARGWRPARYALASFALLSLLHFTVGSLRAYGLLGLGTLSVFVATCGLAWRADVTQPAAD